jgi:hypothetical protein
LFRLVNHVRRGAVAKRLVTLVGMLAMMLATAVPAFAQQGPPGTGEEISVTGVVENFGSSALPPYGLRDEATGGVYYLASDDVDFGALVGQRITAYGTPEEIVRSVVLNVTRVVPADGPAFDRTAAFDFELTVKDEPPAGTTFFGAVPAEGCISVALTDPDGDGVYTGTTDVPRFPPGPVPPPSAEPVSLPVQIVQAGSGTSPCNPTRVIKDFGVVPANDATFKAKISFKGDRGDTTTPGGATPGSSAPGSGSGGSGSKLPSSTDEMKVLPRTGGGLPLPGIIGILLVAGSLLIRRVAR